MRATLPRKTAGRSAWTRLAVWLLAPALGVGSAARAADEHEARAQRLLGYWVTSSKSAMQRALHLTNVIFAEPAAAVFAGFYGTPSPVLPEAREIAARIAHGTLALEVTAADAEKLDLKLVAPDRLEGRARRADGGTGTLRFSRVALAEFHRFIAENPPPGARAGRGARIELVYIGADDCSLCKGWEAAYLGRGKLEASAEWKHLRFTEVKLATLKQSFRVDDVPPRLRPVFEEMAEKGVRIQGVPSFVLLVNDRLRAHALGTAAFDTLVHVALRAAVRERLALERGG